jgi:hypothetical protein
VHEFTYASNAMYHFGPNVVLSLEALQLRAKYLSGSHLVVDHYDLGVAYLFSAAGCFVVGVRPDRGHGCRQSAPDKRQSQPQAG